MDDTGASMEYTPRFNFCMSEDAIIAYQAFSQNVKGVAKDA